MPNRPQYDVAIVGASIAGCTAAILFTRNGARVALIERDPDPPLIKNLHAFHSSRRHPDYQAAWFRGCSRSGSGIRNDVEVFTRWGWIVPPLRRNTTRPAYGYNIRRETLDPMIRKLPSQRRESISCRVSRHGNYWSAKVGCSYLFLAYRECLPRGERARWREAGLINATSMLSLAQRAEIANSSGIPRYRGLASQRIGLVRKLTPYNTGRAAGPGGPPSASTAGSLRTKRARKRGNSASAS
jgi:hypothetical protein